MRKTFEEKLVYLKEILNAYLLFSRHYDRVYVEVKNGSIEVLWGSPKRHWRHAYESIEFPTSDIDIRIEHYKQKVRTAFKSRNLK